MLCNLKFSTSLKKMVRVIFLFVMVTIRFCPVRITLFINFVNTVFVLSPGFLEIAAVKRM